jgi:DNA-binding response OmpR family regulator
MPATVETRHVKQSRTQSRGSYMTSEERSHSKSVPTAVAGPSILLVDDDEVLAGLMSEYFTSRGFQLEVIADGRAGLGRALQGTYDLMILDASLPNLDGFDVLRQLRLRSDLPVVMLTARTSQQERITGLEAGADDYLPKPFDPGELLARVRAVLRRAGHLMPRRRAVVQVGDIRLNPSTREADRAGEPIALTSIEFDILDVLMRSAGRVVSRDHIAAILYQRETTPYERFVDVHISHLRKKLERTDRPVIRTIRGAGYLFVADP